MTYTPPDPAGTIQTAFPEEVPINTSLLPVFEKMTPMRDVPSGLPPWAAIKTGVGVMGWVAVVVLSEL